MGVLMRVEPVCPNCGNAMRFEPEGPVSAREPVPVVCDGCGLRDEAPRGVPVPEAAK